jgi:taurine dioxygenase
VRLYPLLPVHHKLPSKERPIQIEPTGAGLGVIVSGLDARTMNETEWQTVYRAWLDHNGVLVLRGQNLAIADFLAYGYRFGTVVPHVVRKSRHPKHPHLTVMGIGTRNPDGSVNRTVYARGQGWHTDGPCDARGCKGTMLYALVELPSRGGDTLFANMCMAYAALPDTLKRRIEGLAADYVYGGADRKGNDLLEPDARDAPPVRHPLVRTHPETGRKSLYFNAHHLLEIAGLSRADGEALIADLTAHQIAPGAEYRHRWQPGDVVIWDNRCTLHSATADYPIEERRIHWRCTIAG